MGFVRLLLTAVLLWINLGKTDTGQTCSSCSGIDPQEGCLHHVVCNDTEECYMHLYTTESGAQLTDLGCTVPRACPSVIAPILGKRAEGHHFRCMECCNDTALCNQNMTCGGSTVSASRLPRDCSELVLTDRENGSYIIFPYGTQQFPASVRCEFVGNDAWTVIQRRFDGSVDFYRSWDAYKAGFGGSDGEYWLGNDNINVLTNSGSYMLRVVVTDWQNVTRVANYRSFRVADETHFYYLSVWGYWGNAGDSMNYHDGMKFTTHDKDNDIYSYNCAYYKKGGWWYKDCFMANLNGNYYTNSYIRDENGIHWNTFHPANYSLPACSMMVKPINFPL